MGKRQVYDITVEHDDMNFVANGIVVHNSGAQKLIQKFKPRSINDIATATSIYRPGPLNAKVDKIYLENKKNVEKVKKSMHPLVWECLEETYGTIVFQEQVQLVAHKVGGFDLDETDQVRKALMKRSMKEKGKAAEKVIQLGERFVEGAVKNGLTEKEAKKLWDDLAYFSGYGFNKCVTSETEVLVKRGESYTPCKIIDINPGDEILSRDEKTKSVIPVKVRRCHSNGKKKIVRVHLDTGAKVECTIDHKFRTTDGKMIPLWKIIAEDLDIVVDNV